MKILVTGAYGQLGSELHVLSGKFPEWEFLFTDLDTLDITDEMSVVHFLEENRPDFVINCAAYTAVDKAESDPLSARKLNALGPAYLAKGARIAGAGFLHISTDYVFNGQSFVPYSESAPVCPVSVYGMTKLEGEEGCLAEYADAIVIRTSWLYSSFGNNFVKTMLRLGKEREELKVVFDQIGTPTYAADLAEAILVIAGIHKNQRERFMSGIFHYSNEGVASWFDFASAVFEFANIRCRIVPVLSDQFPTPARRPLYSVLDKSKIKTAFDLRIPYWRESLEICINKLIK